MINSDNSIQINIKFTFIVYEYIIVYKYILLSKLIYIYIYIYIYNKYIIYILKSHIALKSHRKYSIEKAALKNLARFSGLVYLSYIFYMLRRSGLAKKYNAEIYNITQN